MKKNLKKISACLVASMFVGLMPVTSMAAEDEVFVSHFDSFENWTSEKGSATDLPDGFFALDVENHPTRASQAGSVLLEEDYTRAIALKKGAVIGYRFDEVYKTGVRRVSFDLKAEAEPTGSYFIIAAHENDGNDNVYDLWNKGVDGTGLTESGAIDWDYSELCGIYPNDIGFVGRHNWQMIGEPQDVAAGTWYKVELVFDCDNDMLQIYFDGALVHERSYSADNKTVYFNNNLEETVYLDNFAVYHSEDAAYSAKQFIKAEAPFGAVSVDGGRLNVDFSRYDAELYFDPADFIVKDSKGNVVADAVSAAGQGSKTTGAAVILNALPEGDYKISYAGAENESDFMVAKEAKAVDVSGRAGEKYFYIDEDFESYLGGIPANWSTSTLHNSAAVAVAGTDANGGKSFKLNKGTGHSYTYRFNEPHTTNDLVVEFDIKTAGGGWKMAILPEKTFVEGTVDELETLGNPMGTPGGIARNSGYTWKLNSGTPTPLSTTDWSHVKVVLNMDKQVYEINANGESYTAAFPTMTGTDKKQSIYSSDGTNVGVGGLRFYSDGRIDTEFDNIKVYTENSYNLYDDLNGCVSEYPFGLPQGWFRYLDAGNHGWKNWYTLANGKDYNAETNTGDQALQMMSTTWREQGRAFLSKPINPTKKAFALEYDIKVDTLPTGGKIKVCVAPIENAFKGEAVTNAGYRDAILDIAADGTLQYRNGADSVAPVVNQTTSQNFVLNAETWYTIKIEFNPKTKGVTAYVNGAKGQTITNCYSYNELLAKYDSVDFVAFWNQSAGKHSIDNVKVYEFDDVVKPSVVSVKVVNADGTKDAVGNKMSSLSPLATGLEIKFSAPLAETATTLADKVFLGKKDGTEIAWTGTLSGDAKTYTIKFSEKPSEDITLDVKYNVKGEGSELAQITENVSYSFKPSEATGEISVEGAKLMKYVPGRTVVGRTSPSVWTKATSLSEKDATDYKIFVSGINTTGAEDSDSYWYLTGTYTDEDGQERMNGITKIDLTIPNQVNFEKQLDIPEVAEGETFKAFVWNTDFMPVTDVVTSK